MAWASAADRVVHPVPNSLVRDASWGSLFLAICLWWLIIGCKHLLSPKLSISFDYQGRPCNSKSVREKYLYYPLNDVYANGDVIALGVKDALNLSQPLCILRCPTQDEAHRLVPLKDVSPQSEKLYPPELLNTVVYESEAYGDFLCVPHDTTAGAELIKELNVSSFGFQVWCLVNSIFAGGAYWTLLSTALVIMIIAPAMCLLLLVDFGLTQTLSCLVIPSLSIVLIVIANKMNLFTHYSRTVMASGLTLTSITATTVCTLSAIIGYVLYRNRAKHNVHKAVLKIYGDAARCIPGLYVIPMVACAASTALIFLSLKTSAGVLITGSYPKPVIPPRMLVPVAANSLPLMGQNFTPARSAILRRRDDHAFITREVDATAQFVTQLGVEIDQMLGHAGANVSAPSPLVQTPKPMGLIDDIRKLPLPVDLGLQKNEKYHADSKPHNVLFKGVRLQTSVLSTFNLIVYAICCAFILECIISIANTFVAAWTTVWYYSPPEVGGSFRCVEASAIRYASLTTFSSHFANIFTTSAINTMSRPITFSCSLLTSIPEVAKWWSEVYSDNKSFVATFYQLCICASSVTIAHSLIHGLHLINSAKALLHEDTYTQCVRRILRLSGLVHQQTTVLLCSVIAAVLTAATCAFTPAFTSDHHDFYVNIPMLTSSVSFVIAFYLTTTLTSSIVQSIDCLICCYQFERSTGSSAAYTPDEFTMIYSDVRIAAQAASDSLDVEKPQELETPSFMKGPPGPTLGFESEQLPGESSALCKVTSNDVTSNDPDAIAMYLQNDGSLTFN